ncbi:MAG: COR domain-containing protein [Chloroflexota bacterium]
MTTAQLHPTVAERIAEVQRARKTTLDLSGLGFITLPDDLGQLSSLQELNLSGNQLSELPDFISQLSNLQLLDLRNNQLSELPDFIGQLFNLHSLSVGGNQLSALPDSIGQLSNLQSLSAGDNQLNQLPDKIGQLSSLQLLYLRRNQLSELPDSISQLSNLELLYLKNNQLNELPDTIGQLSKLQLLDLESNRLRELPDSIGQLASLQELYLRKNQLQELPQAIGQLASLEWLGLGANQLRELPNSIGQLFSLEWLDLESNQISELPTSIGQLPNLENLYLSENQFYPELVAAYDQSQEFLFRYLHARATDEITLHEAKLIFIGEGEVGKSSLLGALRHEAWIEDRQTTHGIDVKTVELAYPDTYHSCGKTLTLRGWDFGGQPIYRPTHQLFFSAPAIYLVVWKPREGPNQSFVQYWIEMIKHRTYNEARPDQRPRIIVVATHGGPKQRQPHIDEQQLRSEFGDIIVGFHHVDSKTGEGIPELKTMIADVASDIPQVGRMVPASCTRIMDALQERSQSDPYISYVDYEQLCDEQDVDAELATLYAAILNELGYCIHYADDSALRDVVILKADWLTKAISFVLEDAETVRNNGLVTHERLNFLWNDSARPREERYPPALHPLFLRLMERFDLSYRVQLEGQLPTSLIAQLVPNQRPDNFMREWPDDSEMQSGESEGIQVCRIVDSESGIPVSVPGIFYRLIVRFHSFSLGRDDHNLSVHWKYGMVLDDGDNGRIFVEEVRGHIHVTVRAVYPNLLLHEICEDVKWIIANSWTGLDCQIMVPCHTENCRGLLRKEVLIKTKKRSPWITCQDCLEDQKIDELMISPTPEPTENDMQKVIRSLTEIKEEMNDRFTEAHAHRTDQTALIISKNEELYRQLMTTMVDEAREGPRLFSITPASGNGFGWRDHWATTRIRLTLWCEHSRLPVPLLSGDDKQGVYIIERPRKWLKDIAPYARGIAGVLSLAFPVVAAAYVTSQTFTIEHDLAVSQAAFDAMMGVGKASGEWMTQDDGQDAPSPKDASELPLITQDIFLQDGAEEYGDLNRLKGAPLRELHILLKELDPTFGGLERVQNNRREFLWVHPKHRHVYDPGFPEFPAHELVD